MEAGDGSSASFDCQKEAREPSPRYRPIKAKKWRSELNRYFFY